MKPWNVQIATGVESPDAILRRLDKLLLPMKYSPSFDV
jgi:hypothetical protein